MIQFEAFSINFSTVFAYRVKVVPLVVPNMNERISKVWAIDERPGKLLFFLSIYIFLDGQSRVRSLSAGGCENQVDFLALVIKEELSRKTLEKDEFGKSDSEKAEFEKFCLSVLLSAYITLRPVDERNIPDEKPIAPKSMTVINCRRRIIKALTNALKSLDIHVSLFKLYQIINHLFRHSNSNLTIFGTDA